MELHYGEIVIHLKRKSFCSWIFNTRSPSLEKNDVMYSKQGLIYFWGFYLPWSRTYWVLLARQEIIISCPQKMCNILMLGNRNQIEEEKKSFALGLTLFENIFKIFFWCSDVWFFRIWLSEWNRVSLDPDHNYSLCFHILYHLLEVPEWRFPLDFHKRCFGNTS